MADLQKLTNHPDNQEIITRLINGETPANVSNWLKSKYQKTDESHLRLPLATLKEFVDKYSPKYGILKKIALSQHEDKLDKEIAASLLNNKAWQQRVAELSEDELDLPRKLKQLISIMEARAEQIFDKIQENPGDTKKDYVFTKYLELLTNVIEKADKVINHRPDLRIEHTHSVQIVEQQSVAMQEAIRRTLQRIGPEYTSLFFEFLAEEIDKVKPKDLAPAQINIQKENNDIDKLIRANQEVEGKLLGDGNV